MSGWRRLGLIAGGGDLPARVAEACAADGRLGLVVALKGFAEPARYDGALERGLGQFGKVIEDLRAAGCDAVCFAGIVTRPDFRTLVPDWGGAKLLPKAVAAAVKGDDALLRVIVGGFEEAGFRVVGAQEVCEGLLAVAGPVGALSPDHAQLADARKALEIAAATGVLDIGQGAVVCEGLVLAVEAQEGTDQMLARVAALPEALRGTSQARRGALAKRPKPQQERRIDLPVIGVSTVQGAAKAGLAGIAVPAGGALILGRAAVAEAADAAGLYVIGLPAEEG
jgi:UDP-2,3-diacylglucosamine hydrolase